MNVKTGSPTRTTSRIGTVAVAFGLMLLHNLDEAFWHPEGDGKAAPIGVFAIAVITLFAYSKLGPRVRGALVSALGILAAVVAGGGHIAHFFTGAVQPIDYSGILFFVGGLLLIWVGWSDLRRAG